MAKPTADAITFVLPVNNAGPKLESTITSWSNTLSKLGRAYEIIVVNDGSTDGTADLLAKLAERVPSLHVLTHDSQRGYGACLRTAIATARHPLFFHTALDTAYSPSDLRKLLERIEITDEITSQRPVLVSGCRTGTQPPMGWRIVGKAWRLFCRIVMGLPLEPTGVWLGFREQAFSYLVWMLFADPLTDPKSAFKLWRSDFLKAVPIQSDSDFVHVELVAKATFLTRILDEVPLSPSNQTPHAKPSVWRDFWRVLRNPNFGTPAQSNPEPPAESAIISGS